MLVASHTLPFFGKQNEINFLCEGFKVLIYVKSMHERKKSGSGGQVVERKNSAVHAAVEKS